jgi:hypothetical protein
MGKNSSNKTRIKLTTVSIENLTEVTKRINSSPPAMDSNHISIFLCNLKTPCAYFKENPVIHGTTQYKLIAPYALCNPEECKALPKHVACVNSVSSNVGVFRRSVLPTSEYRVNSHYFPFTQGKK